MDPVLLATLLASISIPLTDPLSLPPPGGPAALLKEPFSLPLGVSPPLTELPFSMLAGTGGLPTGSALLAGVVVFPAAPGAFGGGGGMTRFVPHFGHTVGAFEDVVGVPRGDVAPGDKAELRGLMGTCWGQGSASCRQPDCANNLLAAFRTVLCGMVCVPTIFQSTSNQPSNPSINQSINPRNNGEIEQTINPFNNGEIEPSI